MSAVCFALGSSRAAPVADHGHPGLHRPPKAPRAAALAWAPAAATNGPMCQWGVGHHSQPTPRPPTAKGKARGRRTKERGAGARRRAGSGPRPKGPIPHHTAHGRCGRLPWLACLLQGPGGPAGPTPWCRASQTPMQEARRRACVGLFIYAPPGVKNLKIIGLCLVPRCVRDIDRLSALWLSWKGPPLL